MIDYEAVRRTLRSRLLTVEGVTEERLAMENRTFSPPEATQGTVWVRETLLPNGEPLVAYELLHGFGIVQYDVFCPAGGGTEDASELARRIGDAFRPAQTINKEVSLVIERAERLPGTSPGGSVWYAIPVRIEWRTYSTLPEREE